MEFDEKIAEQILRKYLPHSTNTEAEEARDRFLSMIRERRGLQELLDAMKSTLGPEFTRKALTPNPLISFKYVDQFLLSAVYLLRGAGTAFDILAKVSEMTGSNFSGVILLTSLEQLEQSGLVESTPVEPQSQYEADKLVFAITDEGIEKLRLLKEIGQRFAATLTDISV